LEGYPFVIIDGPLIFCFAADTIMWTWSGDNTLWVNAMSFSAKQMADVSPLRADKPKRYSAAVLCRPDNMEAVIDADNASGTMLDSAF